MGWQWGGGWLAELGFSDFAGSTLVHSTGGAAALAGAMIIGPRLGRFTKSGAPAPLKPFAASSIPLVTIGVFILWLGWFGFNGGSQLAMGTAVDAIAVSTIFMNTFLAGAIILGPRLGRFTKSGAPAPLKPFAASSIPLITIGIFILWLGWFGFNCGSQLAM